MGSTIAGSRVSAAVGDVFTANTVEDVEVTYKVLTENGTTGTVQVGNNSSQRAISTSTTGTVTIPETVDHGGIVYSVTAIEDNALSYCSKVTNVVIPSSVISIGEGSFVGCSNLNTVTCHAVTPPTLGEEAFYSIANNPALYVPEGCVSAYQDTDWSYYFLKIRVIGDTSMGVGDTFTAANADGVNITYMITGSSTVKTYGYWDGDNNSVVTAVPSDFSGSLTIPETATCQNATYTVTAIGDYSFCDLSGLTKVEIPANVGTIGEYAFMYSSNLNSVTVNSQTPASLGYGAFGYISSDAKLYVPDGCVSAYQNSAWSSYFHTFRVIGSLDAGETFTAANAQGIPITYLVLDENSVMTYSSNASEVKGALYIPETVSYSGHSFTVTRIGASSFKDCTDLTSVTIPRTVTMIETDAFKGCTSLSLTTILSPEITIATYAFYDSYGVFTFFAEEAIGFTSVVYGIWYKEIDCFVPAGSIESYKQTAKNANWSDDQVNRIKAIGDVGFIFSALDENNVNIRYEVTSTSPAEVKVIYEDYVEYFGQGKRSISLPETVTYNDVTYSVTGVGRFVGGNSVTSLFVPKSLTAVDDWAFAGCYALVSIVVDEENPVFDSHDNCNAIVKTSDHILVAGCKNTAIPDDVTAIGKNAFGSCDGLSSITIPSSVTSIGESAFAYCNNLVDVICNAVTPPSLGEEAFVGLLSSAKLYVPEDGLNSYKNNEAWTTYFNAANILPSSQYESFVAEVGKTFIRFTVEGVEVTYQITSLDEEHHTGTVQVYGWFSERIIDGNLTSSNFKYKNAINNIQLTSNLTIPSTVTYGSGDNKFTYTVTEVGDCAFMFLNTGSRYATIVPAGSDLYSTETDLWLIYLPSTITRIGKYAFSAVETSSIDMKYVILPEGVENIDDFAFERCYYIRGLSLPKSLKRIGRSTFADCDMLEWVKVYNPIPIKITAWYKNEVDPQPNYPFVHQYRSGRTLYVPYGSKYKYLSNDYWGFGKAANGSYLEGSYFQYVQMMNNKEDNVTTIEPDDEYSTDFAEEMVDGDDVLNLEDAVAGGVYYNLKQAYSNGFDQEENCIVINNGSDMTGVSGDFDRAYLFEKDYSGMVVEVHGKGYVMIDCQTLGTGKLTVRIGDGNPVNYNQDAKGAISVEFNVAQPTPIYIYATMAGQSANASRMSAPRRADGNCVKIYSLSVVPKIEFSISSVGMGTFACNSAVDFTGLDDIVKVYYATYDSEANELTFHQIHKVPAHTGVLLVSTEGGAVSSREVPTISDGQWDSVSDNVMVQGTGEPVSYDEDNHIFNYILFNGDDGLGFYKAQNNPVAKDRAYIQLPYSTPVEVSVNYFAINLDNADGITTLENRATSQGNDRIYNLAGQRLNKLQPGLNIVNDKKVLVR